MNLIVSIDWGQYKTILEIVYYAIYVVGIPIAILEALRKQRRIVKLEEEKTYIEVNDKYIDFLKLSVQYPHLHVSEFSPPDAGTNLSLEEQVQQLTLYDMLTSIFERAYLLYDVDKGGGGDYWPTWDRWIEVYVRKETYRTYIEKYVVNGCFGETFQAYIQRQVQSVKP